MRKRKALIDGDILCYAVGSFTNPHPFLKDKDGKPLEMPCTTEAIQGFARDEVDRIVGLVNCGSYQIYISGPNNFRDKVAVTHPYKFKREGLDKPYHYQTVKDYYIASMGAIVTDGCEADDALALAQTKDTVICSLDKDLLMVPGAHYNWRKEVLVYRTYGQCVQHFCTQLLTGDWATDSIIGCGKLVQKVYGPKAKKAGQQYETREGIGPKEAAALLDLVDYEGLLEVVVNCYQQEFGSEWETKLNEMASLLCMGLDENNLWRYHERKEYPEILGHLVKEPVDPTDDSGADF